MAQHFLNIADQPPDQLKHMLEVGLALRDQREAGRANDPVLAGQTLAMLFEKPSLRTRVSFQQAMNELGGQAIVLSQHEVGLGQRESAADVARVLAGMVHGIAARVFDHQHLIEIAAHSDKPVVNMLSDLAHPAQALADVMTMMDQWGRSFDELRGRHVAFIGDGNNVARSLAMICGKLGMKFTLASPPAFAFEDQFARRVLDVCPDMELNATHDPVNAVAYADAVYADTFVSMGQEQEKARRIEAFKHYQINDELLSHAHNELIVLHCLPAYRGVEITDAVMDGPLSRVFEQAHNRLHAQKGLLAVLMGGA